MSASERYAIDISSASQKGKRYFDRSVVFDPALGSEYYISGERGQFGSSVCAYRVPTLGARLRLKFNRLSKRWKRETAHLSFVEQMVLHPAYREIIAMGPVAIPMVLDELKREPDFWFWALRSLTGEDPVTENMRGDVIAMTRTWLKWGREHGYIGS